MKHIVQVLTDTNIGGAGKYLINYLKHFDRSSFKVSVVLPEGSQLLDYIRDFDSISISIIKKYWGFFYLFYHSIAFFVLT